MAKRKVDSVEPTHPIGIKKVKQSKPIRAMNSNLLDDESSNEDESPGVQLDQPDFKINEEYAKRFEFNKKREEKHKLEEKYGKSEKLVKGQYGDKYDEDSESSNEEDEDDEGFLATEALDAEISATLQAIRSKDPRVYNEKITFYAPMEKDAGGNSTEIKEKPMYLRDYHRENLLKGELAGDDDEEPTPRTFAEEQDALKESIVKQMHAAVEGNSSDADEDGDGGFLVPKSKSKSKSEVPDQGIHPSRAGKVTVDVTVADKDPETFLSNFMSARAWVPSDGARFQPLESDDEEEDERAEKFEAAYNLRFEDPKGSNEMLKSYARDVVAAKSVRREEPNSRKKQRDSQREKREAERAERDTEKTQLRKLKIEEMTEKLQKIKKAAGIKGQTLKEEEWTKFLDEGYDDDKWNAKFTRHFGDDYYAEQEVDSDSDEVEEAGKKRKVKRPKWDDDIDIKDLIPEFEKEEEANTKPAFALSDSEGDDTGEGLHHRPKSNKDRQQEKLAKKKDARIARKKIENLVDSRMGIDIPLNSNRPTQFRYRETSPLSFGLTARDILMAPDTSLNQFAGLKKMASFRDADKKRKDKKNLGKKARLRQWRKDTFGNEDGPEIIIGGNAGENVEAADGLDIVEGKKKKRRSRKNKAKTDI